MHVRDSTELATKPPQAQNNSTLIQDQKIQQKCWSLQKSRSSSPNTPTWGHSSLVNACIVNHPLVVNLSQTNLLTALTHSYTS